jgi:hypothetical protein
MGFLDAPADKVLIVALAVAGAVIASAGAMLGAKRSGNIARTTRILLWTGYIISFASVVLFISAGFLSTR